MSVIKSVSMVAGGLGLALVLMVCPAPVVFVVVFGFVAAAWFDSQESGR